MNNFDLRKYLAESRLLKEANTPRYPEGRLSIEDKIKAIVPFVIIIVNINIILFSF